MPTVVIPQCSFEQSKADLVCTEIVANRVAICQYFPKCGEQDASLFDIPQSGPILMQN